MASYGTQRHIDSHSEDFSHRIRVERQWAHRNQHGQTVIIQESAGRGSMGPVQEPTHTRIIPNFSRTNSQHLHQDYHTSTQAQPPMTNLNIESNHGARGSLPPPRAYTTQQDQQPRIPSTRSTTGQHTRGHISARTGHSTYRNIESAGSSFQWNGGAGTYHADYEGLKVTDNGVQWNGGSTDASKGDVEIIMALSGLAAKVVQREDGGRRSPSL